MKQYIGTKIIKGEPMNLGAYNEKRGWTIPENEDPNREGYLVEYPDGYISWSPKEVFEEAYRESEGLTFGLAIEALKKGLKVCRSGWNGKGMFLYYVPADSYPAKTDIAKQAFPEGIVPYGAYIALKTAQGNVICWNASQPDALAEDWCIIE